MTKTSKQNNVELCSPEKRAAIVDAISHRIHYTVAAEANGVGYKLFIGWIDKARQDMDDGIENEYTEFYTALKRAEMTKMREHLDVIAARPENWEADAWILERVWPNHYSL